MDDNTRNLVSVNLSDTNLVDEITEIDASEDAFSYAAPVPDDRYLAKIVMGSDGPKMDQDPKTKVVNYIVPIEARVVEGSDEVKDAILFANAGTYIRRGKKVSVVAAILSKLGVALEAQMGKLTLCRKLQAMLKKEPSIYVDTEWQAYDSTDGPRGRTFLKGMKNFPLGPDGKHIPEAENPRTHVVCPARSKVVRFVSVKEGKRVVGAAVGAPVGNVPKPRKVTAPPVEEEVLEEFE